MVKNDNKNSPKLPKLFICVSCDYTAHHKGDFNKHNLTSKHKKMCQMIKNDNEKSQKSQNKIICSCGKEYKFSSGLTRHKKKCGNNQSNSILEILQDNKEFKELLIEQNKKIIELTEKNMNQLVQNTQHIQNIHNNTQNIHNNTQNIQNNATFNLNYFLNTTCKDAINMKDFIESINVNFKDLENTGRNGFVKNITQVITRELEKLEACMRPIHCSDVKRKVLHIRDENSWHKDTEQCVNAKKMVSSIAHKTNVMQIPKWVIANPKSQLYDDKSNDLYLKIVGNSMEGDDTSYDKIIVGVSGKIHVGETKLLLLK
jgi:hypothetical protein